MSLNSVAAYHVYPSWSTFATFAVDPHTATMSGVAALLAIAARVPLSAGDAGRRREAANRQLLVPRHLS